MPFSFGKTSRERMAGIHPDLIKVLELAIIITKVDFSIPQYGGLRTEQEQLKLFVGGKSKADGRVNKSYHQTGRAIDVCAYVNGKADWSQPHMTMVACAILQAASQLGVKLDWGGLWTNFIDMPHFQLSKDYE